MTLEQCSLYLKCIIPNNDSFYLTMFIIPKMQRDTAFNIQEEHNGVFLLM